MTRMTGPDCVVMCNLINTYIHACIIHYITAVHQPTTITHIKSKEIQKVVTVEVTVWLLWYRLGWDGVINFVAGLPRGSSKIPRNWEYLWAFGQFRHGPKDFAGKNNKVCGP